MLTLICLRSGPEADDIIMSEEKNLHAGDQNTEDLNSDNNIEHSAEETVEQPTVEEKSEEVAKKIN